MQRYLFGLALMIASGFAAGLALGYALTGEPQAAHLVCDVIGWEGVCR